MQEIPLPPLPEINALLAYGISAGGIIVGVIILLWGSRLHRAFLALTGAAVGVAIAYPLAQRFGFDLMVTRILALIILFVVGLLLARIIWAVLAGGVFASIAGLLLSVYYLPAAQESGGAGLQAVRADAHSPAGGAETHRRAQL